MRFILNKVILITILVIGLALFFNSCEETKSDAKVLTILVVRDISSNSLTATIDGTTVNFTNKAAAGTTNVVIENIVVSENAIVDKAVGDSLPVNNAVIQVTAEDGTSIGYSLTVNVAIPIPDPIPVVTLTNLMSSDVGGDNITVSTTYASSSNDITEYGFVYSSAVSGSGLVTDGRVSKKKVADGAPTGTNFNATLLELNESTPYYIRAYVVNPTETFYSEEIRISTQAFTLATLSEVNFINRRGDSFTASAVYASGNNATISYGFVYSQTVTGSNLLQRGMTGVSDTGITTSAPMGNNFSSAITNLNLNATYYVRSYAINRKGIQYSSPYTNSTSLVWQKLPSAAQWNRRSSFGLYTFSGQMWLMGGVGNLTSNSSSRLNDIWTTTDGMAWTKVRSDGVAGNIWQARYNFGFTVHNNMLWLLGGQTDSGNIGFIDVWKSADGATWTRDGRIPNRSAPSIVRFNNSLYTTGGLIRDDATNSIYRMTTTRSGWETITPNAENFFTRRISHNAVVFQNKIWVLGGLSNDLTTSLRDVWSSPDGETWTSHGDAPWGRRDNFTTAVYNNRLWVIGGQETQQTNEGEGGSIFKNDVWWTKNGTDWNELPAGRTHWGVRSGLRSAVFNNRLFIMGGLSGNSENLQYFNDVWYLDVE